MKIYGESRGRRIRGKTKDQTFTLKIKIPLTKDQKNRWLHASKILGIELDKFIFDCVEDIIKMKCLR